ncbi:MAG: hypothetical protein GY851_30415 [bacterium]|nr:hypothetical protein [bacterium]
MLRLLATIGILFVVLGGWVAIEQWVRKKSPRTADECDEAARAHGCHHCALGDTCAARPEEDEEEDE